MSTKAQQIQEAVDQLQSTAAPEGAQGDQPATEAEPPQEDRTNVVEIDVSETVEADKGEDPAVNMPNSWSKEKAEVWNTLTPDAQRIVADRESSIQSDYSRNLNETSAQKDALKADQEAVAQQKVDLLKRLQATGPQKPSENLRNPDHEDFDLDQYQIESARFESAQAERQKLENELSLEDAKTTHAWQAKEIINYQTELPEYVHPEKGQAFRQRLADYAVANMGINMDEAARRFPLTPAKEMSILAKAMKWDEAVAKTKASKGKPNAKTLNSGASNPSAPVKIDPKAAVDNWVKDRSPKAAAALLAKQRAKG